MKSQRYSSFRSRRGRGGQSQLVPLHRVGWVLFLIHPQGGRRKSYGAAWGAWDEGIKKRYQTLDFFLFHRTWMNEHGAQLCCIVLLLHLFREEKEGKRRRRRKRRRKRSSWSICCYTWISRNPCSPNESSDLSKITYRMRAGPKSLSSIFWHRISVNNINTARSPAKIPPSRPHRLPD